MSLSVSDRLELHELPGRYGDIIDAKTWDRLDRIFTEDAIFRIADPDVTTSMDGLREIKKFMTETEMHPLAHLMTNVYAEPAGDDAARVFVRALFPVAADETNDAPSRLIFGAYTDDVVKTKQGWRIRHRVFNRTHRP